MPAETTVQLDRDRVRSLIDREAARLDERTQGSARMYERARRSLSGGVASSYQARDPWPIYLTTGEGPVVHDVDGNRMWDFHNGFGSMVQGHAHPAIVRAVQERVAQGTHFAATTEDGVLVAEELQRRWGLAKWRFLNSGSEATMDAIRIARAYTGRDTIVKIFGSYHGHHDAVMVSIGVEYDRIGDRENYESLPYGAGIPKAVSDLTVPVPFNDAGAMERRIERLEREGRKPACVIMEAAMMNLGVVLPEDGYLQEVRDLTARHGIVLIFDEVKTGLAIAAGGATERFGVQPDMVTLAKTLGGGLPAGAIGGTERAMSGHGRSPIIGTMSLRACALISTGSTRATTSRVIASCTAPRTPGRLCIWRDTGERVFPPGSSPRAYERRRVSNYDASACCIRLRGTTLAYRWTGTGRWLPAIRLSSRPCLQSHRLGA